MENQDNKQPPVSETSPWHWGFYFSREDDRVFVPKRRGYGLTINFARPLAYAFLGMILGIPILVMTVILACNL